MEMSKTPRERYPQFVNETAEEYFVRLFSRKEEYGLTCEEIADMLNCAYGVTYDSSVYRKRWRLYSQAFDYARTHFSESVYAEEARELEKQRVRLSDERAAYRRLLREDARREAFFDSVKELMRDYDPLAPIVYDGDIGESKDTLVVCLSDLHIGIDFKNPVGAFNSDLAYERLSTYADRVIDFAKAHKPETCEVVLLGDEISGVIHTGIRVENRESVVGQLKTACELIAQFLRCIAPYFNHVNVRGVSGNHSRVTDYDSVRLDEMLDALIPFYLDARLRDVYNIKILDDDDSTGLKHMYIGNAHIVVVHGELDVMNEAGVAKLQGVAGTCDAIITGHLHYASYKDVMGVHVIQSGTILDSADQYCLKNRLSGCPSQAMVLFSEDGELKEFVPVYF